MTAPFLSTSAKKSNLTPTSSLFLSPTHTFALPSALTVVALPLLVIVTLSEEGGQAPLAIVQRSTFAPALNPVTVVFGSFEFANEPEPLTTLHVPIPTVGVFAAKVADDPHTVWSGPALAVVGG
jgi:hypothetical protein